MTALMILIPLSFIFSLAGLGAFVWAVKSGQFSDLMRDQYRVDLEVEPHHKESKES